MGYIVRLVVCNWKEEVDFLNDINVGWGCGLGGCLRIVFVFLMYVNENILRKY